MDEIHYTLITDGPSDRALLPILTWILREKGDVSLVQSEWADLRRLPQPLQSLHERILSAIDLFPCDLLFIHRDAEREDPESRYREIRITELISDFSPLRKLSAFKRLERDVLKLKQKGWIFEIDG